MALCSTCYPKYTDIENYRHGEGVLLDSIAVEERGITRCEDKLEYVETVRVALVAQLQQHLAIPEADRVIPAWNITLINLNNAILECANDKRYWEDEKLGHERNLQGLNTMLNEMRVTWQRLQYEINTCPDPDCDGKPG